MNMSNDKMEFEELRKARVKAELTDSEECEERETCEGVRIRVTPVKLINIFATTLVMVDVIVFCSNVIIKTFLDVVS